VLQGADIHADEDESICRASSNGHLDVVKYLVEIGANIHAENDESIYRALRGVISI